MDEQRLAPINLDIPGQGLSGQVIDIGDRPLRSLPGEQLRGRPAYA